MSLFQFKLQRFIESNKKKLQKINIKTLLNVFGVSFLISFFIFSLSIYFQNKNLYLNDLYDSINDKYVSSIDISDFDENINILLNDYNIDVSNKIENQQCKSNDQILLNEKLLNVCFNSKEINYYLKFNKDSMFVLKEILMSIPYMLLISILIVVFLYTTESKIFQNPNYIPIERDRIILFINSTINEINNMLLNYTLSNLDGALSKLYDYSIMFIDVEPENYYMIEGKMRKLIETAKTMYFDTQANDIYLVMREIEIHYFKLRVMTGKIFGSYFMMLTSRYYTSKIQLGLFIMFFAFINAVYLKEIYEIPRFLNNSFIYYLSEVTSILSNLGGDISFITSTEYIYNIIIQLIGLVFFGILLGIITKEIK